MRILLTVCLTLLLLPAGVLLPASAQNPSRDLRSPGTLIDPKPRSGNSLKAPDKLSQSPSIQGDLTSVASSGQATAGTGFVEPKSDVNRGGISAMPNLSAAQMAVREEMEQETIPVRQGAPAKQGPISPPTEMSAAPLAIASNQPAAANDMTLFTTHNITPSEVSTTQRATVQEPSVVNMDNVTFFTGNWYAAKSTNGGASFSYISPYTFFPSINGGFCCDQVTAYAPTQDMALWGLQYVKDSTTGTFRIARSVGSSGVAADNWVYYDFNPQMAGFASGNWFDYPSLTVGSTYLYVASNVFRTSDDGFTGSVVMRLPLSNLAAGTGFTFNYFNSTTQGTFRFTEGSTTTMYFASFNTQTQMRIHRWDDSSSTVFWDDINLNAFTFLSRNGVAMSPDGTNWAARADSRPLAAYVANGVIGVMFMAKQDATFPYPYSVHARFNQTTRALITQGQIWNSNYAWLYPSAAPNASGNLAGTLQIGGGTAANGFPYPGTQLWIADDVQPLSNGTVGGLYSLLNSNAGPSNNAWGDFFTVKRHKGFPNSWVASSYSLSNGQTGSSAVPNYTWFGRGRDATACSYSISPTNNSIGSTGGSGSINVTAPAGCGWTATTSDTWITINSGSSGSGNGTVNYSGQANNNSSARAGAINIAGLTFTLNQSGNTTTVSGLRFFVLPTPVRLLDTRAGQVACDTPGTAIPAGGVRTEQARLSCTGVPASAQAIAGNLAAVNTTGPAGFVILYPGNVAQPLAANINYAPGQVINNYYSVGLAADGTFKIYCSSALNVVIDITGYYAP